MHAFLGADSCGLSHMAPLGGGDCKLMHPDRSPLDPFHLHNNSPTLCTRAQIENARHHVGYRNAANLASIARPLAEGGPFATSSREEVDLLSMPTDRLYERRAEVDLLLFVVRLCDFLLVHNGIFCRRCRRGGGGGGRGWRRG